MGRERLIFQLYSPIQLSRDIIALCVKLTVLNTRRIRGHFQSIKLTHHCSCHRPILPDKILLHRHYFLSPSITSSSTPANQPPPILTPAIPRPTHYLHRKHSSHASRRIPGPYRWRRRLSRRHDPRRDRRRATRVPLRHDIHLRRLRRQRHP